MTSRLGVQNTYSHRTKNGNWFEEQHARELAIKEHVSKSELGSLKVHTLQDHLNASLSPAPLTYSPDGLLRFGDRVMFFSVQTEGVLSVDVADSIPAADEAYAVTTSTLTQAHVARNTFTIEPYDSRDKVGDVLRYAQPFRIRINEKLCAHPCFMRSEPVSASSSSRISRHQLVSFCTFPLKAGAAAELSATGGAGAAGAAGSAGVQSPTPMVLKAGKFVPRVAAPASAAVAASNSVAFPPSPYDTVWKCAFKDVAKRFEYEGQPVPANAELLIEHAHTKHGLSSDKLNYYNDFGVEFEVSAHTHLATNKKQNLYAELRGTTTVHTPVRHEHTQNMWAILTAPAAEDAAADVKQSFSATGSGAAAAAAAAAKPASPLARAGAAVIAKPPTPKVGQSAAANGSAKQPETPKGAAAAAGKPPSPSAAAAAAGVTGDAADAVAALREVLMPRGAAAVHSLSRFCRTLDATRSGSISAADLSGALDTLTGGELQLSRAQWHGLCNAVATGRDTQLAYAKVLALIRGGDLTGRRAAVVARAWQRLDKLKRGLIRVDDVAAAYDASADPLVKAKSKTPLQVVQVVAAAFDGYGGDNTITAAEFADYYATVSAFVQSDDFFIKTIAAAYKVAAD